MTNENGQHFSLSNRLSNYAQRVRTMPAVHKEGKLSRVVGLTLEAIGCEAPVGTRCLVINSLGENIEAEVVGFSKNKLFLMCVGDTRGLSPDARIIMTGQVAEVPVDSALLGRVLDGSGNPLDGLGPVYAKEHYPLTGQPTNPLERAMIRQPLDVGVRAINALLTVGIGQRMGLFAGSGVGKSVLLGMMTRYTNADVIVVGLIGERGREVKEFIECSLGKAAMHRACVIAAPADHSPLMRLRGAMWATTIAEYFRDRGANVLLLMDSLTRYAQAQREIGLAIGEPPATKGYPPSAFARLPQLVERAGNAKSGSGSITAFYTVLVEGDDHQDPIADAARAILDGHIVLQRSLADAGHYPAIDVESSVSRVMEAVTDRPQQMAARDLKRLYSKYQHNRDLVNIGAYSKGSDPELDQALLLMPKFKEFLVQEMHEQGPYQESVDKLFQLFK